MSEAEGWLVSWAAVSDGSFDGLVSMRWVVPNLAEIMQAIKGMAIEIETLELNNVIPEHARSRRTKEGEKRSGRTNSSTYADD